MKNVGKALILGLSLAGSGLLAPVVASAQVGVDITVAPPAPRVEVVPPPRVGFVWAPGYWEWRGRSARLDSRTMDGRASRAITGCRIAGSNAAITGITGAATGSAEVARRGLDSSSPRR